MERFLNISNVHRNDKKEGAAYIEAVAGRLVLCNMDPLYSLEDMCG